MNSGQRGGAYGFKISSISKVWIILLILLDDGYKVPGSRQKAYTFTLFSRTVRTKVPFG